MKEPMKRGGCVMFCLECGGGVVKKESAYIVWKDGNKMKLQKEKKWGGGGD